MGISRLGACASYLSIYLSLLIKQSEACWWRYRWDFLLIFFSYVLCIFLVASTTSETVILWKQNDSLWVTHTVTHDAQNWFMEDENRFTQNTGHFVLNIEFIWPDGFILPIARVIYSHDWFRNNGLRGLHHAFSRETSFSTNNDEVDAWGRPLVKRDIYFTFEFRNYLDLFSPPVGLKTAQIKYVTREKIPKIRHRGSSSAKHPGLGHFTLLLCGGQLRNIQLRILM